MATRSFFGNLTLDTPEAVATKERGIEKYERESSYTLKGQVRITPDFER